jgi:putative ABC transport system substrate-binding protein
MTVWCSTVGRLIILLFTILVGPLGAAAQQVEKGWRIGWLAQWPDPTLEAFRQGLRELGYVEGQHITIEIRSAEGREDRLGALAAELVRLPVDVLVTAAGNPAVRAAKDATSTIPIVFAQSGVDPVAAGLITSLAQPDGNVTGLTAMAADLTGKRLQLLKEAVPVVSRVAVLWNATIPDKALELREVQVATRALGMVLQSLEVQSPDEFEKAFDAAIRERADALIVLNDFLTYSQRSRVVAFAVQNRLPTVNEYRGWADAGGLMAYGPDRLDMCRRAAVYVDKILKGAKPADLPVERPTKFELVINLKTAQALGLTIPPTLLFQADEVIR